jgi:predicted transcriptional regulator
MKICDLIVELLSKEQHLCANEIFEKIQKPVTYQAVHKTLKQMVEEKVLCKEKQLYSISLEYVIENKRKWEKIEKQLRRK